MQSYSFKTFFDESFEPSDYAEKPSRIGVVAFWSLVILMGIGA